MSAKDDLDRFESAWAAHLTWRKCIANGPRNHNLVLYNANGDDIPNPVREMFMTDESILHRLDEMALRVRKELRLAARAEAERTLATLSADEQGGE